LSPITRKRPCRATIDRHWCRIDLSPKPERPPASRSDEAAEQPIDQAIRCAVCSAVITHHNQALQINNRHEHTFFNPAGITFELRCFRQAPGGSPHGEPSAEFTWFPGYRWQIVLCATCRTHLGWLFTGTQSFFGLITNRLR